MTNIAIKFEYKQELEAKARLLRRLYARMETAREEANRLELESLKQATRADKQLFEARAQGIRWAIDYLEDVE